MQSGLEIAYRHMDPSPKLEDEVAQRMARLERLFGRVTSCRVTIDAPQPNHRGGDPYHVRLEARIPTTTLVVDREPGDDAAHHDAAVALRDAFDALEGQIERWKERHGHRSRKRG